MDRPVIQLTDTQLAQYTACGLIVVDGEQEICPQVEWHIDHEDDECFYGCDNGVLGLVAPEFWRKLTEPCPTCDETAERLHDAYEAAAADEGWTTQERSRKPWSEVPEANKRTMRRAILAVFGCLNPDCDRGHQVVTLTKRCHKFISHFGATWHYSDDGQLISSTSCVDCDHGKVTLGRFTIRLLPIYADQRGKDWPGPHVEVIVDCAWLWLSTDSGDCHELSLDPLPQPGQWAVQFEAVA